jgi:hypothetical protein
MFMKSSAPRKSMPSAIREVLIPEAEYREYQSLKSDHLDLLQTLLEHHLCEQEDIYYHGSSTARRSRALLMAGGLLDASGNLTPAGKVLPLFADS